MIFDMNVVSPLIDSNAWGEGSRRFSPTHLHYRITGVHLNLIGTDSLAHTSELLKGIKKLCISPAD